MATLCSSDRTIKVNIGIIITSILPTVSLVIVLKYTAVHTRKLHMNPSTREVTREYDILVWAILMRLSVRISFKGVFKNSNDMIKDPHRFPRYTNNQFLSNSLIVILCSSSGIISKELPVNNSVFKKITRINPIGNTNPDNILAIL